MRVITPHLPLRVCIICKQTNLSYNIIHYIHNTQVPNKQIQTREGFFKKKHSCGFILSTLCYTPISYIFH